MSSGEIGDRSSQKQVFANLAYAYTQLKDYENAVMTFKHTLRAAKDSGDKNSQCLSTEGLAAVYFRMGAYSKSVMAYKEALNLISQTGDNSGRSERIVSKLSDAIQFELESKQDRSKHQEDDSPTTNEQVSSVKQKKPSNTMRYFQDKQHSLIAKGLEAVSSSDENEAVDEEENALSQVKNDEKPRPHISSDIQQDSGMNFSMKSTLNKNYYEQPNTAENEMPRAAKEYYLAKFHQESYSSKNQPPERKETSKMCLIM